MSESSENRQQRQEPRPVPRRDFLFVGLHLAPRSPSRPGRSDRAGPRGERKDRDEA